MFSSNQIMRVSGKYTQVKECLKYALIMSGNIESFTRKERPSTCVYQITPTGKYCIGWGFNEVPNGWEKYPFDFDINIIADIITQFIEKAPIQEEFGDGSYKKGFLMENISCYEFEEYDKLKNSFYGIVAFSPYTCFYHK